MPIYTYKCQDCGITFDIRHEIGGKKPHCPECDGEVYKVYTPVIVQFKGRGFYSTDSKTTGEFPN